MCSYGSPRDPGPLQVRLHSVEGQRGNKTSFSVLCPRSEYSVPLQTCAGCEHCLEIALKDEIEQNYLRCAVARRSGPHSPRAAAAAADATPVSQIMPRTLTSVTAELDLETLRMLFLDLNLTAAPVVDEAGRTLGVISQGDLLRFDFEHRQRAAPGPRPTKVTDLMTPMAFSLAESASIAKASALMAFEGVHQVAITGLDQRVVGMISSLDILRWLAFDAGYVVA